jgi:hypothetical protein
VDVAPRGKSSETIVVGSTWQIKTIEESVALDVKKATITILACTCTVGLL